MTKQELLDDLDALRGAVDKLPEDVDVLGANIGPDFLGGTVIGLNHYAPTGIEDVANVLNVAVETGRYGNGKEWYFMLGSVKVAQLGPTEADDA